MKWTLGLVASFALACGCSSSPPAPVADRAHASVISDASQLIGGPKASGQVGDFLIANTHVRFIVAAAGRSRAWFPTGGLVLDADRARAAGDPGDDRLQELATRLGAMRLLYADSVEIAHDGSDGQPAVIRVTGHDIAVPILQSTVPAPASNVTAVTEYRLAPYSDSLEIVTTVTATSAEQVLVGDVFELGDFVTLFLPGYGTDRSTFAQASAVRYMAAFGGKVSYGYVAPGRKIQPLIPQNEIFAVATDHLRFDGGGSQSYTRFFTVGDNDAAALLPEIVRREGGDPSKLASITGTITEQSTNAPIAGATIAIANGQSPYTIALSDASGNYVAPVERASYLLQIAAPGRMAVSANADVSGGQAQTASAQLSPNGRFALDVRDALGAPSPARVQLFAKDGSGAGYYLSADGKGGGSLPPGDYTAVVSRGYEWEAASVPFTIATGMTTTVPATIARVVDTSGWVAIDSHTHTAISVDSGLDPHERVAQALADGVELVITTDHDVLFDLSPTISEMMLAGGFATAVGCEVSPVPGHINGYPVSGGPAADTDGYWPVKWWSETPAHEYIMDLYPSDIFTALRSKLGAMVVQINHPRSGQGVFNWVGYDRTKGLAAMDPAQLDANWDVMEVCNAGCDATPGSEDDQSLLDYYSFLNQGLRKGAVGVSDAHVSSQLLGRARTMVEVGDDDPRTLDTNEVWTSLRAGRAVVMDGAFVTITLADDAGAAIEPGGLAKATGASLTLHVKVQAPSWIPTDHIRVIVNGAEISTIDLPPPATPPPAVRYDADVTIPAPQTGDAWVLAIVDGDKPMAPVIGSPPRSITNPIYIDRNGDGTFQAPGI